MIFLLKNSVKAYMLEVTLFNATLGNARMMLEYCYLIRIVQLFTVPLCGMILDLNLFVV